MLVDFQLHLPNSYQLLAGDPRKFLPQALDAGEETVMNIRDVTLGYLFQICILMMIQNTDRSNKVVILFWDDCLHCHQ